MKRKNNLNKIDRSNEDLINQLKYCLNNLVLDAREYDNGNFQAIRRSSATIRMLFHDSRTSHSILNQISDKEKFRLLNTFIYDKEIPAYFSGVLFVQLVTGEATYKKIYNTFVPDNLLAMKQKKEIPFKQWWEGSVYNLGDKTNFSRKDIILTMANQDGGAHVDPKIDFSYSSLANGITGWNIDLSNFFSPEFYKLMDPDKNGYIHPKDIHLAIMRKIVHEVLYSLPTQVRMSINYKPNFLKNLNKRLNNFTFNMGFEKNK